MADAVLFLGGHLCHCLSVAFNPEQGVISESALAALGMENFAMRYKAIDEMMLDELESMFICMYTTNVNASW